MVVVEFVELVEDLLGHCLALEGGLSFLLDQHNHLLQQSLELSVISMLHDPPQLLNLLSNPPHEIALFLLDIPCTHLLLQMIGGAVVDHRGVRGGDLGV